jgi:hypothetical protein
VCVVRRYRVPVAIAMSVLWVIRSILEFIGDLQTVSALPILKWIVSPVFSLGAFAAGAMLFAWAWYDYKVKKEPAGFSGIDGNKERYRNRAIVGAVVVIALFVGCPLVYGYYHRHKVTVQQPAPVPSQPPATSSTPPITSSEGAKKATQPVQRPPMQRKGPPAAIAIDEGVGNAEVTNSNFETAGSGITVGKNVGHFKADNNKFKTLPVPPAITQGPCSNLQIGGSNNQQTTNCVPAPPSIGLSLLRENVKVSDNLYRTDFRLVVMAEQTIPFLYLRAESPHITNMINFVPENGKSSSHQKNGGYGETGFYGTNVLGVSAGSYIVSTFSTQPENVILTDDPNYHSN